MAGESVENIYGSLSPTWRIVRLSQLLAEGQAELQTGPFGTMLHASAYRPTGTPVIAVQHIGDNKLKHDDLPRVDDETAQRLSRYKVRRNDILFGRKGAVERRALIQSSEADWLQGSDCIRLRFGNAVDARFISYVLGSTAYKQWIVRHAHGATMPSLNQEILGLIPIPLCSLQEQQTIAHILGTLDDKIELNRRMNATLEAMARALFQSWFVDFDPVRAKLDGRQPAGLDPATAALFPDRFQESEIGQIPYGWTHGGVGEIGMNSRNSIQPSQISPNTPYIALEHMPRRSIALGDWDQSAEVESGKSSFREGEILFGKLRPYFHKVGVAPVDGVCSTDILVIAPKSPEWFGYLLCQISSDELIQFTDLASTGTKMPRTNWSDISSYKIALPTKPLAVAFTRIIHGMVERIIANLHQSRTLAALRDTLLPKLLSGEITTAITS